MLNVHWLMTRFDLGFPSADRKGGLSSIIAKLYQIPRFTSPLIWQTAEYHVLLKPTGTAIKAAFKRKAIWVLQSCPTVEIQQSSAPDSISRSPIKDWYGLVRLCGL